MDIIFPLLFTSLGRQQRAAFFERVFPAMLPVAGGQRLTFTALIAEQQVRRQSQIEEQLVGEAVKAAKFKTPDQLNSFPTLLKTFNNLSAAAQGKIFPSSTGTP